MTDLELIADLRTRLDLSRAEVDGLMKDCKRMAGLPTYADGLKRALEIVAAYRERRWKFTERASVEGTVEDAQEMGAAWQAVKYAAELLELEIAGLGAQETSP